MDKYYDYEAQQPLPDSTQVKVTEIAEKLSNIVTRMFNITKDINFEDSYDIKSNPDNFELIEVISE
jgi:hypothetical protein